MRKRIGYAWLGLLLVAISVADLVWLPSRSADRAHLWALVLFLLLPDVALLLGLGNRLQRGQIHPRAVIAYNLVHRLWGPAITIVLGLLTPSSPLLLAGLGWAVHVAADRALGFGLRDRSGFIRPV
jgi:hypothetical protein